eukprot:759122-Hanusia_phi.AAC.3
MYDCRPPARGLQMAQAVGTPITFSNPSSIASRDDIIYDDFESSDGDERDGTEFDELSEFLSDDALRELTGCEDLNNCLFLEARVNSEEVIIRNLGEKLPRLIELKLNNSNINSIRDLGTAFKKLMVLDLEGNSVTDISEVQFLVSCSNLSSLTLEGNPVSKLPGYYKQIMEALPFLQTLDDQDAKLLMVKDDTERSPNGGELFALNTSMDDDNDFLDSLPSDLKKAERDEDTPDMEHLRVSYNPDNIEELLLVHQGIKHARTDFVSLAECEWERAQALSRPSTTSSLRSQGQRATGSRPASALPMANPQVCPITVRGSEWAGVVLMQLKQDPQDREEESVAVGFVAIISKID